MKAWYWCPSCQRAFQGEAATPRRSPLAELLTELGVREPAPIDCPFEDCRATARLVMTWASLRRWVQIAGAGRLPIVPVEGERYEPPDVSVRQQATA